MHAHMRTATHVHAHTVAYVRTQPTRTLCSYELLYLLTHTHIHTHHMRWIHSCAHERWGNSCTSHDEFSDILKEFQKYECVLVVRVLLILWIVLHACAYVVCMCGRSVCLYVCDCCVCVRVRFSDILKEFQRCVCSSPILLLSIVAARVCVRGLYVRHIDLRADVRRNNVAAVDGCVYIRLCTACGTLMLEGCGLCMRMCAYLQKQHNPEGRDTSYIVVHVCRSGRVCNTQMHLLTHPFIIYTFCTTPGARMSRQRLRSWGGNSASPHPRRTTPPQFVQVYTHHFTTTIYSTIVLVRLFGRGLLLRTRPKLRAFWARDSESSSATYNLGTLCAGSMVYIIDRQEARSRTCTLASTIPLRMPAHTKHCLHKHTYTYRQPGVSLGRASVHGRGRAHQGQGVCAGPALWKFVIARFFMKIVGVWAVKIEI